MDVIIDSAILKQFDTVTIRREECNRLRLIEVIAKAISKDVTIEIDYENYRGERAWRVIAPTCLKWGETEFHAGEQWLVDAMDVARGVERTFALAGVHDWKDGE